MEGRILDTDSDKGVTAAQNAAALYEAARRDKANGNRAAALEGYRRALAADPGFVPAHVSLGIALREEGALAPARAAFEEALRLAPAEMSARLGLANVLAMSGEHAAAEANFRAVLALVPDQPQALAGLGQVLVGQQRMQEARTVCAHALRWRPDSAELHFALGQACEALGDRGGAQESYRRSALLDARHARARSALGLMLFSGGEPHEGLSLLQEAATLAPGDAIVHSALGKGLRAAGDLGGALAAQVRALALDPRLADAHCERGAVLVLQGEADAARKSFETALGLDPAHVTAGLNLAISRLLHGDFERGLAGLELRRRLHPDEREQTVFRGREWRGEDLRGRTILVWDEAGLGDNLHFLRYVPLLQERGASVVLGVPPPLVRLAARMAGVRVISHGSSVPAFDCHCPVVSLPLAFGTRLESIPSRVPYLSPDPLLQAQWRERLGNDAEFRVGLVWAGNPAHPNDRIRSMPLETLAPLLGLEGVRFLSLQKGPAEAELGRMARAPEPLGKELSDMDDTAAVIACLDLIVCVDTSVAHLAGALAKPVWMMVPHAPDWRWLLGREDSPWYPTMRLFRQDAPGAWAPVIERVAAGLRSIRR